MAMTEIILALSGGAFVCAFFALGMLAVLVVIAVLVFIDDRLHKRRLAKMQRETMEAHQREREITRRARFLL